MKNFLTSICFAALVLFNGHTLAGIGADTSFGDNGYDTNGGELDSIFENAYTTSDPFPYGDGGVLVPFVDRSADNQFNPGPSLKLVRLNDYGSLSPSFGTGGIMEIAPVGGRNYMEFRDAIPVPEAYGTGWYILFSLNFEEGSAPANYSNGGIVKIDSAGQIATQWADNGFLYWEGGNDFQQWGKLHINPDTNKLYVFGEQNISEIVRFTPAGQVDTTFFDDGIFTFSYYDEFKDARVLAAKVSADDNDAWVIVSGIRDYNCTFPCDARVSVLKMDFGSTTYVANPGGQAGPDRATFLDTTFGTDGEIVLNPNVPADGEQDNYDSIVRAFPFADGSNALVFGAQTHYSDTTDTARIYRFDEDFLQDPNYGFGEANGRADLDYAAEKVFTTSSNELIVFTNRFSGHYGTIIKLTSSGGLSTDFDEDGIQDFEACQDNSSQVGTPLQMWSPTDGEFYMLVAKDIRGDDTDPTLTTARAFGIVKLIDGGDVTACGPSSNPGGGGGGVGPSFEDVPGLALAVNAAGGSVTVSVTGIDARMENGDVTIFPATDGPVSSCTYDADAMAPVPAEAGCRDLAFSENSAFFCADSSTFPPEFNCSEIPSDGQAELVLTQLAYREYDGTGQEETPPGCDSCDPYTRYNYEIVYEPFDPTVTYRVRSMFNAYDESTSTELRQEAEPFDFQVSGGDSSGGGSEEPSAPDADSDGVPDAEDAFPNDPEESADADADGVGANADPDDNDASFTGSPVVIAASDYSAVQVVVGEGQVLINGSPVTATTTSVAVAVGVVPNGGPSAEQVVELQNYADQVKAKVDAALETGASSPITVVDTDAGASIRGLIADEDVPIENIAIIEVADPRLLVLVTGKNANGELATITDGGTIEFGLGGRIVVLASGMEPGDQGEIVLFSEPDQLAVFDVDAGGVVQAEAVIPADTPVGEHTLVVAAPNLFSSLGFRVVANTRAQSDATPVPSLPLGFVWLLGLVVAYAGSRKLVLR